MENVHFVVDHVDSNGDVTKSYKSDELNIHFYGRNICALLCNAYNDNKLTPLGLNIGPAPRSILDYEYQLQKQLAEEKEELEELRKQNIPIGFGSVNSFSYFEQTGAKHWIMLDDLLKIDYSKIVKIEKENACHSLDPNASEASIEDLLSNDFLQQMRTLVEQGFNRITFYLC